jgi:hypothetical protein
MARIIAFYLPQFHPIPENNSWWGPGFTEWHNVAKARPLFKGHVQPQLPGELGFYDLRFHQTREDQALLAKNYGVFGFCYWHYWFGGHQVLEKPLDEVIKLQAPDFPFCVGWANESWTGIWHGAPKKVLIEQNYPINDPDLHYEKLSIFFHDDRYIKHQGKPLLYVYKPNLLPKNGSYLKRLRELAVKDGFPGLYILGTWSPNPSGRFNSAIDLNLDGAIVLNITGRESHLAAQHFIDAAIQKFKNKVGLTVGPNKIDYRKAIDSMLPDLRDFPFDAFNTVVSNWDNTPRSGRRGLVLTKSSPELFESAIVRAIENTKNRYGVNSDQQYVFLKSWNEWAEGNYVEPDQINGRAYLESIQRALNR